ncbi:ATP-dependent DNA ligase [Brevundimonas sp.]|uniref:ATP-dependent DNA ligase n=1 Tax=Brevundimonas sp. TaxID=1871086 RepID=UPI002D53F99D|nr:ATP-dependent DNA ligase [Brevundimonas sp.]HYC69418.1 ATP-dependent DNA ligase [Brevundimonas sp.]
MTFLAEVVRASERVAAVPGRLAKIALLADLLKRLDAAELAIAIAYLSGEMPQGRLALPYSLLASARGSGATQPSLTILDLDSALAALKAMSGKGVSLRREAALKALFARATTAEQEFLVRLIVGELRQGALEGVMLEAVAAAAGLPVPALRRAATFAGGVATVARAVAEAGPVALDRFTVTLMRPVLPMLAQPAADAEAALATLGTALVEWKLDGARVQVHKADKEVKVFTRSLKEVTAAVPEVVEAVRAAPSRTLILDGEAIALRPDGSPHSFQTTMRRFGRRLDDAPTREALPLSVFFFDCMLADGEPLVDAPLDKRRTVLERCVPSGHLTPARRIEAADEAVAFYDESLAHGHEGIMAKAPDSIYEAGRRGGSWLKVKRSHTLDLVVLAAEWGNGRRQGRLSNLHLGARDEASGRFVMLGKTFKGLTDALLEWQTAEFLARETRREGVVVHIRPELVVEIAFNDVQKSPQYAGGMALRFARVKRYRPDKTANEADTLQTVRRIFETQGPR